MTPRYDVFIPNSIKKSLLLRSAWLELFTPHSEIDTGRIWFLRTFTLPSIPTGKLKVLSVFSTETIMAIYPALKSKPPCCEFIRSGAFYLAACVTSAQLSSCWTTYYSSSLWWYCSLSHSAYLVWMSHNRWLVYIRWVLLRVSFSRTPLAMHLMRSRSCL